MNQGGRLPRLRIAHRLGIAIVITLTALFLFDQGLRRILPPPPFLITNREWLVDTVAQAAKEASKAGPAVKLSRLPGHELLTFSFEKQPSASSNGEEAGLAADLRQQIAGRLDIPVRDVQVGSAVFDQNRIESTVRPAAVIVEKMPIMLTEEVTRSPNSIVVADLVIQARLDSGVWLVITPRDTSDRGYHYLRVFLGFGGSLLFIVIFSLWMARTVVQPLTRLADAAERLGRSREPTLVTGMKIPEYVTIANSFNDMQLRLKRFLDERVQMLAAISHDLRTPLTRLRLLAEYLPDEGQRNQLLGNITDIEAMVTDTLAFMSDEVHREPFALVDLASLLISITDDFCDAGAVVTYAGPDHLAAELRPHAMKRALINLIDNGCKYGGAVWIALHDDGRGLLVDVADAGPGIDEADHERAFQPFERLEESRSRETGGTGLGLTIARDIIQQHGGTIAARWISGRFTMRVTLPPRRE